MQLVALMCDVCMGPQEDELGDKKALKQSKARDENNISIVLNGGQNGLVVFHLRRSKNMREHKWLDAAAFILFNIDAVETHVGQTSANIDTENSRSHGFHGSLECESSEYDNA